MPGLLISKSPDAAASDPLLTIYVDQKRSKYLFTLIAKKSFKTTPSCLGNVKQKLFYMHRLPLKIDSNRTAVYIVPSRLTG